METIACVYPLPKNMESCTTGSEPPEATCEIQFYGIFCGNCAATAIAAAYILETNKFAIQSFRAMKSVRINSTRLTYNAI